MPLTLITISIALVAVTGLVVILDGPQQIVTILAVSAVVVGLAALVVDVVRFHRI